MKAAQREHKDNVPEFLSCGGEMGELYNDAFGSLLW